MKNTFSLLLVLLMLSTVLTALIAPPVPLSPGDMHTVISDTTQPATFSKKKKRRDSVPPPPLKYEDIEAQFNAIRYSSQEMGQEAMQSKAKELMDLRDKASWLVKFMEIQGATPQEIDKAKGLSYQVRTNWAVVNSKLTEMKENKGIEAMKKFEKLLLADVYDTTTQQANVEVINSLKENLFYSKKIPTINCSGGIGDNLLKGLEAAGLDRRLGCVGYITSLDKNPEFNLIALKLSDGEVKLILWGKNAESKTYGAHKIF